MSRLNKRGTPLTATEELGSAEAAAEFDVASLSVRFGALTAQDGVSLAVRAGEIVALAGENGVGKTTLIRAIVGDVAPAVGTIRLGGRPVTPTCGGPASRARSRYRRGRSRLADGGLSALDVECLTIYLGRSEGTHELYGVSCGVFGYILPKGAGNANG